MTSLLPIPSQQWLDDSGAPLAGGQVFTYIVDSTTPKSCWLDPNQISFAQNPQTLDADGRCTLYGTGTYRLMVYDANGVLVTDGISEAPMTDDAINLTLLPCLQSSTWQEFRDCSGITAAINAACAAIDLMPGPVGPVGSQGIQGVQGVPGPAGSSSSTVASNTNPGFWYDPNTQFLICFGVGVADNTGLATINFPKVYTKILSITCTPLFNAINLTCRVTIQNNNAFEMWFENTDNQAGTGFGVGGGTQFNWSAFGFG